MSFIDAILCFLADIVDADGSNQIACDIPITKFIFNGTSNKQTQTNASKKKTIFS